MREERGSLKKLKEGGKAFKKINEKDHTQRNYEKGKGKMGAGKVYQEKHKGGR